MTQPEALREALTELVACDALAERLAKMSTEPSDHAGDREYHALGHEWESRRSAAWEAARAALQAQGALQATEMWPTCEVCGAGGNCDHREQAAIGATPEPDPPSIKRCPACNGVGSVGPLGPCPSCKGFGSIIDAGPASIGVPSDSQRPEKPPQ